MNPVQVDLKEFDQPGLYLIFPDGKKLALTRSVIEETSERFLSDSSKIPPAVKAAADYQMCSICPEKEHAQICHALMPTLPFLEILDTYFSCDRVTALYRDEESRVLHTAEVDLQQALQYVSIMSLMYYCETGRKYYRFFKGIVPLVSVEQMMKQVLLNMYWQTRGDHEAIRRIVKQFREELAITTECQVKRLRLICKHDTFINTFVKTQIGAAFLNRDLESMLKDSPGAVS